MNSLPLTFKVKGNDFFYFFINALFTGLAAKQKLTQLSTYVLNQSRFVVK